ncbi:MAG: MgtC/SapB family protein [Clostridiales bacterium]|nr:MgtC/SapB family protein [Clostridiales bacterium]
MLENIVQELTYLISVLVSVVLGFVIGFERKLRSKEAGIRTHTIVCAGSALIMVVSKYGFGGQNADASRIASQIVSGIGFLGAGMIVYRQHSIHGLTTAAGVWATAGVGMAAGAGLYIVALGATVLLILVQIIFHSKYKVFRNKKLYKYNISFENLSNEDQKVKELFGVENFHSVSVKRVDGRVLFDICVLTEHEFLSSWISETLVNNPYISSIRRVEDN